MFFTVLEAGKSKTKVPASLVPRRGLSSWLTGYCLSMYPHTAERERGRKLSGVSSYKGENPIMRAFKTLSKLYYLSKAPPSNTITLGVGVVLQHKFGGGHNSVHNSQHFAHFPNPMAIHYTHHPKKPSHKCL